MNTTTAPAPALRRIADLPAPPGLPLIGNAHQITLRHIHQDVERWAREYGPFFSVRLGKMRALVVTDHEVIAHALKDRPDGFRRTIRTSQVGQEMGLKPGVFGAEGQAWRDQRRMVMASFAPGHVRAYFPSLQRVVQRLHARWHKAMEAGNAIPLQEDLMRYTVDGVAGLAFGQDINTLESDEEVIQQHLDKIFPALFRRIFSRFPYWRYVRLPRDRALDRSVAAIHVAIAGFIAQARARMAAQPALRTQPSNLLEGMIAAADEGGSGLTDEHVAGNVITMLLAGEDTTANTLAWMIWLLHRNPDALRLATEEVQRVAPDPRAFTPEQMASLDYLEACASETMRLKPVAPFLVLEALQDTALGDVQVPKGTFVWCVLRHDSVSERHFPDPLAFNPSRWLAHADPALTPTSPKRVAMPFGAGPRVCPGRYLALLEIKMAMAMLLSSFEIDEVRTLDGREPAEKMAFAMAPVGLQMRLKPRAQPVTTAAPDVPSPRATA
ncbi:cytochrome P450 [Piscinibacter sp. HJYY11]|uniref:cytochrome P450 n=1 Tax=Piscinibacter sp. HJYY11 TaxID=2801333 RepID=UPI00191E5473|nr:cytochrome P450 [Piscinibacter sp. HJYY11]MBL0727426.1 cytochrome P450 [Piscinibacter sp. HJYY11]